MNKMAPVRRLVPEEATPRLSVKAPRSAAIDVATTECVMEPVYRKHGRAHLLPKRRDCPRASGGTELKPARKQGQ